VKRFHPLQSLVSAHWSPHFAPGGAQKLATSYPHQEVPIVGKTSARTAPVTPPCSASVDHSWHTRGADEPCSDRNSSALSHPRGRCPGPGCAGMRDAACACGY